MYTQFENLSSKKSLFVKNIIERYKSVHKLKHDKDVAERMGMTSTAFSNQKGRGSLDLERLIKSCDADVNLHWLLTGEGDSKFNDEVSAVTDKFSDYEALLNDPRSADIAGDDFLEFVVRQQEALLEFLRKMKDKGSDD